MLHFLTSVQFLLLFSVSRTLKLNFKYIEKLMDITYCEFSSVSKIIAVIIGSEFSRSEHINLVVFKTYIFCYSGAEVAR